MNLQLLRLHFGTARFAVKHAPAWRYTKESSAV
nr:MAG TPA: Protein gmr sensing, diffusible signal factor.19A [Caudoviricetes sp.]